MNYQDLLNNVRGRTTYRGISTAAPFLRELTTCLGGVCPSKVLGDVSTDAWNTMLKEAESRLVYHADDMTIGDCGAGVPPASERAGGTPTPQLPPHTIATFPAVITTTRQDRDGDVLETKGAELDPAAPLLWQHLTTEPIGRLLKEGKRTKTSLAGSFAIAATALGQDAALLAEHGALRISHGFLPDEFEPLDAKDAFSGFHITAFKILEVSLVSVPSNPDAVITQFSREKLHHPLVRAWAGAMFRARPILVSGGVVSGELGSGDVTQEHGHNQDLMETMKPRNKTLHRQAVHSDEMLECATRGSVRLESLTYKSGRVFSAANEKRLQAAGANFKAIANDDEAHPDVVLLADKGYRCVQGLFDSAGDSGGDSGGQDDMSAYTVDGASGGSNEGSRQSDRRANERGGKSGRAVSAENAAVIQEAIAHGRAIKSHEQSTPGHKSMAKTAIKKLKSVLGANQEPPADPDDDMNHGGSGAPNGMAPDPGTEEATSFAANCKGRLTGLFAMAMSRFAATNELHDLKALERALGKTRRQVRGAISRIERQREHDDESAALAEIVSEFGR